MKRTLALVLAALAAAALFGGLVHTVLWAAHVSEPAATTVHGPTARRLWATASAIVAIAGVVMGWRALRRSRVAGRARDVKMRALMAVVAGLVAVVSGGLNLAVATGGPGTGNGVVGAAAALVLGLTAVALGGMAVRSRSRHD